MTTMPQINFAKNSVAITKKSFWDTSLFMLFTVNIATIIATLYGEWQLTTILFIYWAQSVTIGVFNVKRMAALDNFSTRNIQLNGKPVMNTDIGKKAIISFFIMHYGIFHLVYFVFLLVFSAMRGVDLLGVLIASSIFIVNHYYSHKVNLEDDKRKLKHIVSLMFHPYVRIIPMHLTIILAFIFSGTIGLIIFMSLKTIADLISHIIEHAKWKLPANFNTQ